MCCATRLLASPDILPTSYPNMPIFWSDEQLKWLTGSYILQQVADRTFRNLKKQHMSLTACFRNMDKNGDSRITVAEMKRGFQQAAKIEMTDAEAQELFDVFDVDGSGEVDLGEMLPVFKQLKKSLENVALTAMNVDAARKKFKRFLVTDK